MAQLSTDSRQPRELIRRVLTEITAPTRRDRQVAIGPSSLGDPCDYCVGKLMAQRLTGAAPAVSAGNLASWIGTAIHEKIERTLSGPMWEATFKELKDLVCGHIPTYGDILGTADFYSPEFATVVDWKSSTKKKIKNYQVVGIPPVYDYQRNLYAKGVKALGFPVRWTVNVFIPRDSWLFKDIWYDVAPYRPQLAVDALQRATTIWTDYVQPGSLDTLGSDDECFDCTVAHYFKDYEGELIVNGEG